MRCRARSAYAPAVDHPHPVARPQQAVHRYRMPKRFPPGRWVIRPTRDKQRPVRHQCMQVSQVMPLSYHPLVGPGARVGVIWNTPLALLAEPRVKPQVPRLPVVHIRPRLTSSQPVHPQAPYPCGASRLSLKSFGFLSESARSSSIPQAGPARWPSGSCS
jgi:hypothetical protein